MVPSDYPYDTHISRHTITPFLISISDKPWFFNANYDFFLLMFPTRQVTFHHYFSYDPSINMKWWLMFVLDRQRLSKYRWKLNLSHHFILISNVMFPKWFKKCYSTNCCLEWNIYLELWYSAAASSVSLAKRDPFKTNWTSHLEL